MHTPPVLRLRFAAHSLLASLVLLLSGPIAEAQSFFYSTFAGVPDGPGSDDGAANVARFRNPTGIARDAAGNLYIADTSNHTIRRIALDGTVSTLAGTPGQSGSTDATGAAARFSYPWGVAVDGAGNVYVADSGNHTIRRVTPARVVTTVAGSAGLGGSEDGTGSAARFFSPSSIVVDGANNLYVTDYGNSTIRRITPAGVVTTFAGSPGQFGTADGTGTNARFNRPDGMAFDSSGNLFVADTNNHVIRRITPAGVVSTFVGMPLQAGAVDGVGSAARFNAPVGLAFDAAGDLLVTDRGNATIRRISSDGGVITIGGVAGQTGLVNGSGSVARFEFPTGIVVGASSGIYITDTFNEVIRRGVADVLSNTASSGSAAVWLMDGTTMTSQQMLNHLSPDWRIVNYGRFNNDAHIDLIVQNNLTGMRAIWLMNGSNVSSVVQLGVQHLFWQIVAAADFNGDNQTDLMWQHRQTGQRVVWFMNGTTRTSILDLGTGNPDWKVAGAADYNADGKPDLLMQNFTTGAREIWLLNGTATTGAVTLGNQHQGWQIMGASDFNGDGKPDIVWQDVFSGLRVIWLMNGTARSSIVSLGTHARSWQLCAAIDANGDGMADLVWQNRSIPPLDFDGDGRTDLILHNTQSGAFKVWLLNGTQVRAEQSLGSRGAGWRIAGLADFDGDRSPDIIWQNLNTGAREIWLMQETQHVGTVSLGTQDTRWQIVGAADFNGDSQIDLVWQNTQTGERTIWFMDGPAFNSAMSLGSQPLSWDIVGAADFNGDGQAEIIWQNRETGLATVWFMNGLAFGSAVSLGTHSTALRIVGAADFNGDGQTDLAVENVQTGERLIWLMSGFNVSSAVSLGTEAPAWTISN